MEARTRHCSQGGGREVKGARLLAGELAEAPHGETRLGPQPRLPSLGLWGVREREGGGQPRKGDLGVQRRGTWPQEREGLWPDSVQTPPPPVV